MRAKAQRGDARAAAGLGGVRTRHGKKKALTDGDHVAVSVRDGREGTSGWAGGGDMGRAERGKGEVERAGPGGNQTGRRWRGFGQRERKEKEMGLGRLG